MYGAQGENGYGGLELSFSFLFFSFFGYQNFGKF